MASYKLNIGRIKGCPPALKVQELLEKFGVPEKDEYGVLNHNATEEAVTAAIVRRTNQTYQRLDPQTKEVTSQQVEKVTVYPFTIVPRKEALEVYAGSAKSIEEIGLFLSTCLGLAVVAEGIELDVCDAIDKLTKATQRFQIRSVRVSDFAHNSYMIGPYSPKFQDSEHGKDFMQEYAEAIVSASVRFQGPHGKVTVGLSPKAAFSFSCNEEDPSAVKSILRTLA